jgi:hypothetical protein
VTSSRRLLPSVRRFLVNAAFLAAGGSGGEFCAGLQRAIAQGWLCRHESGTYLKFTDSGAALFA